MQAYCASRVEGLHISDADVVDGFLHIHLTSNVPLFLLFLANLPHPLVGHIKHLPHWPGDVSDNHCGCWVYVFGGVASAVCQGCPPPWVWAEVH